MNTDLLVGLIIGLSGSILALIGTIISNSQRHRHEIKMSLQKITLENSFKEYELKTNLVKSLANKGEKVTYYPYELYLITYNNLYNFLQRKDVKAKELEKLIQQNDEFIRTYEKHHGIVRPDKKQP